MQPALENGERKIFCVESENFDFRGVRIVGQVNFLEGIQRMFGKKFKKS